MPLDDPTGGYWLVASDGGVFAFNARYFGFAVGAIPQSKDTQGEDTNPNTATASAAARDGGGYWIQLSRGKPITSAMHPALVQVDES